VVEDPPKKSGKLFSLLVLASSLIISVAGLYIMLTNWGDRGSHPLALGLSVGVLLVIFLIISMMWRILAEMRKLPEEDSLTDPPYDSLQ
jgi:hypothetical protein